VLEGLGLSSGNVRFLESTGDNDGGAARAAPQIRVLAGFLPRGFARALREVVARNDADDAQVGELVRRMAWLCRKGQQVALPN
jgi:hypothetical protein